MINKNRFVEYTFYLHNDDRSQTYGNGKKLGMSDKAAEEFSRACYEVKLQLHVDIETGKAQIVSVHDVALVELVDA